MTLRHWRNNLLALAITCLVVGWGAHFRGYYIAAFEVQCFAGALTGVADLCLRAAKRRLKVVMADFDTRKEEIRTGSGSWQEKIEKISALCDESQAKIKKL